MWFYYNGFIHFAGERERERGRGREGGCECEVCEGEGYECAWIGGDECGCLWGVDGWEMSWCGGQEGKGREQV